VVRAGQQLADAAYPPDGWWLDFPGMGRYVSTPTSNPKNLRQAEVDRAAEMDHGLMWFVEQSEVTPINNTTDDDRRLADQSAQMAVNLNKPPEAPHMFAVDTDGRPYMDQVRAAFVTYRQRIPSNEPIGAYAGSDVIDQLIADGTITYGHIPAALSWSSTSRPVDNVEVFQTRSGLRWDKTPNAQMLQYPSEAYRGGRIDRSDVTGEGMPVWFPGRTNPRPPDPPQGAKDVPTLVTVTDVMILVSPSSPPVHTHASWVRTWAEVEELSAIKEMNHQSIDSGQCHGIRLSGPCPEHLKGLFHPDSTFDGQNASTTVPPHTHSFSGSVSGSTGPVQ
jgi:hypothetical protein